MVFFSNAVPTIFGHWLSFFKVVPSLSNCSFLFQVIDGCLSGFLLTIALFFLPQQDTILFFNAIIDKFLLQQMSFVLSLSNSLPGNPQTLSDLRQPVSDGFCLYNKLVVGLTEMLFYVQVGFILLVISTTCCGLLFSWLFLELGPHLFVVIAIGVNFYSIVGLSIGLGLLKPMPKKNSRLRLQACRFKLRFLVQTQFITLNWASDLF